MRTVLLSLALLLLGTTQMHLLTSGAGVNEARSPSKRAHDAAPFRPGVAAPAPPPNASPPPVNPPRAAARASRSRPRLNWHALAMCESTNNPRAVSPGGKYRGLYQFSLSTWRSVGGTGDPIDASPAEQTRRAHQLYLRRGRQPWPHCGRHL